MDSLFPSRSQRSHPRSLFVIPVVLSLIGGLLVERTQAEILFWPARMDFLAGESPSSVAIADLNGDQVPDLAVANARSNNVTILLGQWDSGIAAGIYFVQVEGRRCRRTERLAVVQ